jgi:hypothetical protein
MEDTLLHVRLFLELMLISKVKKIYLILFPILLLHFSHVQAQTGQQNWTPLFDGKTLNGWAVPDYEAGRKVEIRDSCITIGRDDLALGVRYVKPFPRSNYEIMYQAKRISGRNFFGAITFPVKESHCSFINGGWGGTVFGLSSINGKDASENETTAFYEFCDGQWYQFRLCVSEHRIIVWFYPVDGEVNENPKIDLVLEGKTITNRIEVSFFEPLGISAWYIEGHLRRIKYRKLTPDEIEAIRQLPWNPRAGTHYLIFTCLMR